MDWEPGQDPPSEAPFDPCKAAASPAAVSRPHPTPADRAAAVASNPGAAAGGPQLDLKRRLYFLSGFDPRGASFYFRLLSQELESRNAKTPMGEGQPIKLLRRRQEGDRLVSRWRIQRSQPNRADFGCIKDKLQAPIPFPRWATVGENPIPSPQNGARQRS